MNIYVDFDDCLCETARYFSGLVKEMFGITCPYEKIRYFNLQKSFSLTDEDYDKMMIYAHQPRVLLSYEETPGAVATIKEWLNEHGLERLPLYCLNKYGRDNFIKGSSFNLELEGDKIADYANLTLSL